MSSDAAYFPDALASAVERVSQNGPDSTAPPANEVLLPQFHDFSDEELLEQVGNGAKEALGTLFRRYARSVRSVAHRILRDEAEADDLLQDVFLFLFRTAARFDRNQGSAGSWIIQVTYHRALDRRRYLMVRHFYQNQELDEEFLQSGTENGISPAFDPLADGILGKELLTKFRTRLSPEQQETIHLFFFGGYTLREIAERTGQNLGNVRNHYYRGLERLRAYAVREKVHSK